MPECCEARVVAEHLAKSLTGLTLLSLQWDQFSRYNREEITGYADVQSKFPATIKGVTVKGKHIIFIYQAVQSQDTFYSISFLGMEGKFLWEPESHSNLTFHFGYQIQGQIKLNVVERILYFDDSRHFGAITFYPTDAALITKLNTFGPDVLAYAMYLQGMFPDLPESEHITAERWREKFRNKRLVGKEVGVFLLDQGRFSGVGNYIRAESLYKSRISPHRPLGQLTDAEIEALRLAVFDVVYRSYRSQGHTLKSYRTPYGEKGEFECVVYGKSICPLGHPVTKTVTKDGRTAHWVPNVQI
jgi:formamidopyrimidine-DNA glycosylase